MVDKFFHPNNHWLKLRADRFSDVLTKSAKGLKLSDIPAAMFDCWVSPNFYWGINTTIDNDNLVESIFVLPLWPSSFQHKKVDNQ